MTVAHDSLQNATLTMRTDRPLQAGAASNVVMRGDKLQWTQDLSGKSCKATAVLISATPVAPGTMKGKLACDDGDITFSVRKKAE